MTPGAPRERSHSEWAAGETAPSRRWGVGRKRRYRWRKTGRRWEWQGPWEAGRREPGESAWWGALKPGGEAQAGQVLPQPGEPSSPGWHLLHPSFPAQPRKADRPPNRGSLRSRWLSPSEITLARSHPGSVRCGEVVPHLIRGAAKTRLGSRAFRCSGLAPRPVAPGKGGCRADVTKGSSFALAACATPSNAPIPLTSRGPWAGIRLNVGIGDATLWVGTCPRRRWQIPLATYGACVQAAAETQLSHPWSCRCAMGREAGRRGASPESTSALHGQMLSLRDLGRASRWKESWGWKQRVPQARVSFRAGGRIFPLRSSAGFQATVLRGHCNPSGKTLRHAGPPPANPGR